MARTNEIAILAKYCLFFFNLLLLIAGLIILIMGAIIAIQYSRYVKDGVVESVAAPVAMIVIGCIIAITSILGCCGAIRESYTMLIGFAITLFVIFLVELSGSIAVFVLRSKIDGTVHDRMVVMIHNYGEKNATEKSARDLMDGIQSKFHCCGINSYTNWLENPNLVATESVPDTCCLNKTQGCGKNMADPKKPKEAAARFIYTNGCAKTFSVWLQDYATTLGGIGLGFLILELLGICLTCYLAQDIRRSYESI